MELSQFVAQLLGITYLAVGIGFLNSRKHYEKMLNNFVKDPAVMYLGGLMALIIGFLLVTYHNIWVKNWTVLITILGWGALLKGVLLLAIPKTMADLTKSVLKTKQQWSFASVFVVILGLVFAYYGFFAV